MHVMVSVLVWVSSVIVVIGGIGFVVLDAMDKVESITKRAPGAPSFRALFAKGWEPRTSTSHRAAKSQAAP